MALNRRSPPRFSGRRSGPVGRTAQPRRGKSGGVTRPKPKPLEAHRVGRFSALTGSFSSSFLRPLAARPLPSRFPPPVTASSRSRFVWLPGFPAYPSSSSLLWKRLSSAGPLLSCRVKAWHPSPRETLFVPRPTVSPPFVSAAKRPRRILRRRGFFNMKYEWAHLHNALFFVLARSRVAASLRGEWGSWLCGSDEVLGSLALAH